MIFYEVKLKWLCLSTEKCQIFMIFRYRAYTQKGSLEVTFFRPSANFAKFKVFFFCKIELYGTRTSYDHGAQVDRK